MRLLDRLLASRASRVSREPQRKAAGSIATEADGLEPRRLLSATAGGDSIVATAMIGQTGHWWSAEYDAATEALTNRSLGRDAEGATDVLAGDFDGDGRADRLLRRADGTWDLAQTAGPLAATEWTDAFSRDAVQFRVGDFNGDGADDLVAFEPDTAAFPGPGTWMTVYGSPGGAGGSGAGRSTARAEWLVMSDGEAVDPIATDLLVADVTGDGVDDLVLFDRPTGRWTVGVADAVENVFELQRWGRWGGNLPLSTLQTADLNGDGTDDLIARNGSTGQWYAAVSEEGYFRTELLTRYIPSIAWSDIMVADFTGDGRADVAARHENGGWYVAENRPDDDADPTGSFNLYASKWGGWIPQVPWTDITAVDVDGDGRADVLGRDAASGAWWMARSDGDGYTNRLIGRWSANLDWRHTDAHRGVDEVVKPPRIGNLAPTAVGETYRLEARETLQTTAFETLVLVESVTGGWVINSDHLWTRDDARIFVSGGREGSSYLGVDVSPTGSTGFYSFEFETIGELRVGQFNDASRYPFNNGNGVSVSSPGRGDNGLSASFVITHIEWDEAGELEELVLGWVYGQSDYVGTPLDGDPQHIGLITIAPDDQPIGLLANDTDPDEADTLYARLVTGPRNGTIALEEDGSFTYTPTGGFIGVDTFTYRAHDDDLESEPVTVRLEVGL